MKYTSKTAFVERMHAEHARFLSLAASIPRARYDEPGVWGEGWTVKDLFAHLTEWEQMLLAWYNAGLAGARVQVERDAAAQSRHLGEAQGRVVADRQGPV